MAILGETALTGLLARTWDNEDDAIYDDPTDGAFKAWERSLLARRSLASLERWEAKHLKGVRDDEEAR